MSFQNMKVEELKELAAFYTVEPKVANADNGPTKELLAALAEENVSKEDYETFLEAKKAGTDKTKEEKREELAAAMAAAVEEKEAEEARLAAEADPDEPVDADAPEDDEDDEDEVENEILVKMERRNGTYETHGLRFTKAHPFKSVPESVAESIIKKEEGFRLALPSEVKDYYN